MPNHPTYPITQQIRLTMKFLIVLFSLFIPTLACADIIMRFDAPFTTQAQQVKVHLSDAPDFTKLIKQLNKKLPMTDAVILRFVDSADEGPFYDSEISEIHIPYQFWTYAYAMWDADFKRAKEPSSQKVLTRLSDDVLAHTILHEAAHAYIDKLSLPITGREENAADEFAALMLMELLPDDGPDMAISAADFFQIEGLEVTEIYDEDVFSAHALDDQRFYNLVCLIAGVSGNEDAYQILDGLEIEPDQIAQCTEDAHKRQKAWGSIIANAVS